MCQASSTCGRVLARALVQVLQNSASWMVVLRFTTLSERDCHWRNPRNKNCREQAQQYKKLTCQCTDGLRVSAMPNGWGATSVYHSSGIKPLLPDSLLLALTTQQLVCIDCWEKRYMSRCILPQETNFFAYRTVVPFDQCILWHLT